MDETKIIGNAIYKNGFLWTGYDYKNQCWVENGIVQRCGHPGIMDCRCYGRKHAGEKTTCTEKEVI